MTVPKKKLNDEDVFQIKKALLKGVPQKKIASDFHVSKSLISKLKTGVIHKKIVVLSEAYSAGYEKGFQDGIKKAQKVSGSWEEFFN